jgi:hypothetical protein
MQEINDKHKDIDIWDEVPGWAVQERSTFSGLNRWCCD